MVRTVDPLLGRWREAASTEWESRQTYRLEVAGEAGATEGVGGAHALASTGAAATSVFSCHPPDDRRSLALGAGAALPKASGLAAFDFATGTLILTEAGTKRRASLHLVQGPEALSALDPGGIDPFASTSEEFG